MFARFIYFNYASCIDYYLLLSTVNETLLPNWQKEPWQTFEEASGYMRPERVNKWPNSMTDR
jgi:hypothetical protein